MTIKTGKISFIFTFRISDEDFKSKYSTLCGKQKYYEQLKKILVKIKDTPEQKKCDKCCSCYRQIKKNLGEINIEDKDNFFSCSGFKIVDEF